MINYIYRITNIEQKCSIKIRKLIGEQTKGGQKAQREFESLKCMFVIQESLHTIVASSLKRYHVIMQRSRWILETDQRFLLQQQTQANQTQ